MYYGYRNTHVVSVMRIFVRTFGCYGADVVQHRTVFGGPQSLAGHVRRQHFGTGCGRPEVLRARERIRPRVRRYGLHVAAVGRVRAAVTVGVAHRWTLSRRRTALTRVHRRSSSVSKNVNIIVINDNILIILYF